MADIRTYNKIDPKGLRELELEGLSVSETEEKPQGLLIRSYKLHDAVFNPELVAIARAGIGVDNLPIDRCTREGIAVFNAPGANAEGVKELAVWALIMSSRDISGAIDWVKTLKGHENPAAEAEKGKAAFAGPEITGKTLGIIGLGAIGSRISRAAVNLGMTVLGYDPYLSVDGAWGLSHKVHRAVDINTVYRESDYILVQLHYTEQTHHMIDAEAISKMKPGVRIINLARGEIVDNRAILDGIDAGKVARYVTDFPAEEIIDVPNIIVTPHIGASTPESEEKCAVLAARELADYILNGNVRNSVNFPTVSLEREGVCRLCVFHRNVPRMINSFLDIIGGENINVEHMINKPRGDVAYTIIDTGSPIREAMADKIRALPDVMRVRVLA